MACKKNSGTDLVREPGTGVHQVAYYLSRNEAEKLFPHGHSPSQWPCYRGRSLHGRFYVSCDPMRVADVNRRALQAPVCIT